MAVLLPSLLSCDFLNIQEELKNLESAGIKYLHCDVMDGHFVPNLTFGSAIFKQIKIKTSLKLDVHLMVNDVDRFIDDFIEAGADSISIHIENTIHLHKIIKHIKNKNVKAGIAINPGTSLVLLEEILPLLDFVLIMSVNPGFGGQKFIEESIEKIKKLKDMIQSKNLKTQIAVDGGINRETAPFVVAAGCDKLIVGSAFFGKGSANYRQEFNYYDSL
jgi:ribulose-phosphate 3-epimerase